MDSPVTKEALVASSPAIPVTSNHHHGILTSTKLRREFKERHISMIAVAGAMGTGLIIGSGTALVRGGPGSTLLAYLLIGSVVYFVMTAVAEMSTMFPMDKGFSGYATRFVDPALGFATGWNYFLKYGIVLPNNLTAVGIIIQYWRPDLDVAIFVASFTVLAILVNVVHVSYFGETEFWLSVVKLLVMAVVILTCFVISLGGSPSGERIGFKYWHDPGSFGGYLVTGATGRFLGFWAAVVQSCFVFIGTETVGIAFGEAPNPRRTIPKAIGQTLWRIVFIYILGILVLTMSVPYTNDGLIGGTKQKTGAAASPFVIAIQLADIPVFPHVINACLLVFVVSAANSDIYIASRSIFGLAHDGQAPAFFKKTTASGVPVYGVAAASAFSLLGYMNVTKGASTVFGYFVTLVTVFGTLNWVSVLVSYFAMLRGMKAQGISRKQMPYRGVFQPYGAYFAFVITVLVTLFNGYKAFIHTFDKVSFVTSYIGIIVYVLNTVGYKLLFRTKRVTAYEMDLVTGRLDRDGSEYVTPLERGVRWVKARI